MTDRYYALTVVLEKDIREDDAEMLINAILMLKKVINVEGNVANPETWMAETRAKRELGEKLWRVLYSKDQEEK